MASIAGNGPVLNPRIGAFFSDLGSAGKALLQKASGGAGGGDEITVYGILLRLAVIFGVIFLFSWLSQKAMTFETKPNVLRISKDATQAQVDYAKSNPKRKSLWAYLQGLQKANIPANQMCLTNFYVSTVNATGIFFPSLDGVASTEAARTAVLAGARAFVLDIWPDLTAGANYGPIIQVVEEGSDWRRISLNSLPLSSVIRPLMQEGFQTAMRPGIEDPMFLYLRFRGNPRSATFEATARVLSEALEQYRLDSSFNNCRAQDILYTIPLTQFSKKVVIFSNMRAVGTTLADYINVGPKDGISTELSVQDVRAYSNSKTADILQKIKTNLTWVAPPPESSLAENNDYDWEAAQGLGINFCAMNFWNRNDRLKKYLSAPYFGTQSFLLKPASLRYTIEIVPDPKQPFNPKWGSGTTAGTLKDPPAIKMP
jgi:hypothetical protein